MRRQLQIHNGVAVCEWQGSGGMPVPPDETWTFLDVTDRPEAQVGMLYDADTDTFTAPPAPPDYGLPVSSREFFQLLTFEERRAFRAAAQENSILEDFLFSLQLPSPIYLKHPTTLDGLAELVAQGVLTAERRDAIIV